MKRFWNFVDQRKIVRRICLYTSLYLEFEVIYWAMGNAVMLEPMQIAAVTGPMSMLFAAALKFYNEGRNASGSKN